MNSFTVSRAAIGKRLDVVLAEQTRLSRTIVQRLIKENRVTCNTEPTSAKQIINADDIIGYELPVQTVSAALPAPELKVLYEDEDIVVVDKPAGLLVHPGNGRINESTVADFSRAYGVVDEDDERPGIVHRLDRDTSGILIIAKNPNAKAVMQQQFADREVKKTYHLLVVGRVLPESARIDLPIGRDPRDGSRRTVVSDGRPAQTSYKTLAYYPGFTYIEASPETGRTHQLRVHFSSTGNPIVGDRIYGAKRENLGLSRQFLHAAKLSFISPSGKHVDVESQLPQELEKVLAQLAKDV